MKKIFSVILVVCMILTLPVLTVFADLAGSSAYDITTSDVITDLKRTYIDVVQFDEAKYPLNPEADYMLLLNVIEYAWADYGSSDPSPYGLYFYLYNPSGDKPLDPGINQVQMSVAKDDFYVKYFLELVSATEDYRFLKFRITTPTTVYKRLWSDTRTYKISGIEIETKAKGVKEYKIAGTYTFTGTQAAKTLACKVDVLTTLSLNVGDTCYRTDTSAVGEYHRNQLDSVYFSIPNQLLDLYGYEIYKIAFEMSQKRITGIVTSDKEAFDGASPIIMNGISPTSYLDFISSYSSSLGWSFSVHEVNGILDWSKPYAWNSPAETRLDYISYFAYTDEYDPGDFTIIDGEKLLAYWENYPLKDESCLEIIPKQRYEIGIDDLWTSADYQSNHNFLQTMMDFGLWDAIIGDQYDSTLFQDVKPFETLTSVDLNKLDNIEVAAFYYVLEHDVNSIRQYVEDAESSDATTFLFRFNKQDFFAMPGGMQKERVWSLENVDLDSWYFEEYIFEDFDILEIQLRDKKNVVTILPVVMSPVTIVPDIEAPITNPFGDENGVNPLSILLIVLAVVVVIWVISNILPKRVKVINGRRRRKK